MSWKYPGITKTPESFGGEKLLRLLKLDSWGYRIPPTIYQNINADEGIVSDECLDDFLNNYKTHIFIVRSSFLKEDTFTESFAGQGLSITNVAGGEVLAAAKEIEKDLKARQSSGAIFIQRQIDAGFSGVLFTYDPLKNLEYFHVHYVPGLCHEMVQGRADPVRLKIFYRDFLRGQLPDCPFDLGQLLHRSLELESRFAFPCDIEFGFEGEDLYFFQVRPMTNPVPDFSVILQQEWADNGFLTLDAETFSEVRGPLSPLSSDFFIDLYAEKGAFANIIKRVSLKKAYNSPFHLILGFPFLDMHKYLSLFVNSDLYNFRLNTKKAKVEPLKKSLLESLSSLQSFINRLKNFYYELGWSFKERFLRDGFPDNFTTEFEQQLQILTEFRQKKGELSVSERLNFLWQYLTDTFILRDLAPSFLLGSLSTEIIEKLGEDFFINFLRAITGKNSANEIRWSNPYELLDLQMDVARVDSNDSELVANLDGFPDSFSRDYLLDSFFILFNARESGKLKFVKLYQELRQEIICFSRENELSEEDVFFFHKLELMQINKYRGLTTYRLPKRKEQYWALKKENVPSTFSRVAVAGKALQRLATGSARGLLKIWQNPEQEVSEFAGKIGFSHYLLPELLPYFKVAAGWLCTKGSLLSHAAILLREYGLPGLSGVVLSKWELQDGDEVEITSEPPFLKKKGGN
ncbi:PEP/pyruvate-binding domain-containing protein [Candidatus Riflebacteria bacterium]